VGETPGSQEARHRGLQQFDRCEFQRSAPEVAADVHAKVVFFVGGFASFNDLCVSFHIELQELLVPRHDPEPLAAHFSAQARVWESGLAATFLEQLTSTTGTSL